MSFFLCLPHNQKNIPEQFANMKASNEGTSMNTSFHSSGNINELALQDDSDVENNDLEDNEDNYHQLFGTSDDKEIDFYGFSDEEEISCPDQCPDDNAQPVCKKKEKKLMNTLMAGI